MPELTITGRIAHRPQRNRPKDGSAPPPVPPTSTSPPGPTRLARMLGLSHFVERQIEAGVLRDHAAAALRLGITRARMSQIARLAFLSIPIQEDILLGRTTATERQLRSIS